MRKNIQKVIEAYKQGKAAKGDSKGTCSTDGNRIFSYSTIIAERVGDKTVIVGGEGISRTTTAQLRAVKVSFGI